MVGGAVHWNRELKISGEIGGGEQVEKKRRCDKAEGEEGNTFRLFRGWVGCWRCERNEGNIKMENVVEKVLIWIFDVIQANTVCVKRWNAFLWIITSNLLAVLLFFSHFCRGFRFSWSSRLDALKFHVWSGCQMKSGWEMKDWLRFSVLGFYCHALVIHLQAAPKSSL